jgi:hypothetical protein
MGCNGPFVRLGAAVVVFGGAATVLAFAQQQALAATSASTNNEQQVRAFIAEHCLDCHDSATKTAELSLESLSSAGIEGDAAAWEHVVRRLRARQMPPPDAAQPDEDDYIAVLTSLETELDRIAEVDPKPGRTDTVRRLSRSEYRNAIRDLLALDVNVDTLLPPDAAGHGFDTVAAAAISPTLLARYVTAAQKISRLAVGSAERSSGGHTIRLRPDITQEEHVAGLPLGTRGGTLIAHTFPQSGTYEVQVRLARDRNEQVEGLTRGHELEVLLDRERVAAFTIHRPKNDGEHATADSHLKARVTVSAGLHKLGVTFLKDPSSLLETERQPFAAHYNMHRHPRITPAVYQVTITGPFAATGRGDSLSRQRIFTEYPANAEEEEKCASRIMATLIRRAYRRPLEDADLDKPMQLYREARKSGDFETGIEAALSAVLVSPHFLLRIERDPDNLASQSAYRVSDIELASRLSFFLWSSIPDDELLDVAIRGELRKPDVLEQQVRRMLEDERSRSLVTDFAGQWLHLRNLESMTPDLRLFPDFDDNLRQAFREETERLFESVVREDRSVFDMITADFTFLNERLAKHYGIPHIYGSRFRRVSLDDAAHRGGILRHGSILTVTSYATRTSPVIRGHWVMKNLLGMAPPPPPPNVPTLTDNTVSASLPIRERLIQHRADAACASCHDRMDPVGFSLENFDAVGRWRDFENGTPVDAAGGLADGSEFNGVDGLEQALLRHRELFVGTMAGQLLTFALGRGMEHYDAPAIRKIVRDAAADDYRFSSLVLGIVRSTPFQMRMMP